MGDLGNEILTATADIDIVVEEPFKQVPPFRPEPDVGSVRAALAALAGSKQPVIVAGGGVTASGARTELIAPGRNGCTYR